MANGPLAFCPQPFGLVLSPRHSLLQAFCSTAQEAVSQLGGGQRWLWEGTKGAVGGAVSPGSVAGWEREQDLQWCTAAGAAGRARTCTPRATNGCQNRLEGSMSGQYLCTERRWWSLNPSYFDTYSCHCLRTLGRTGLEANKQVGKAAVALGVALSF